MWCRICRFSSARFWFRIWQNLSLEWEEDPPFKAIQEEIRPQFNRKVSGHQAAAEPIPRFASE